MCFLIIWKKMPFLDILLLLWHKILLGDLCRSEIFLALSTSSKFGYRKICNLFCSSWTFRRPERTNHQMCLNQINPSLECQLKSSFCSGVKLILISSVTLMSDVNAVIITSSYFGTHDLVTVRLLQ